MQKVFSNLKLNNFETKTLYNAIRIIENDTVNVDLDYETIINELLLLYEDAIQKGIYGKDFIHLIEQHIVMKNNSKKETFNYLLSNKNILQNIFLLAIFYHYGIGTEKNEIKAFELYKKAAEKGYITSIYIYNLGYCYQHRIETE